MSNDNGSLVVLETQNGMINQLMVDQLKKQRELLVQFTSSQLRKEVDYGIIPGTKKNSLFKPGAEKLRTLFNFSITIELSDKEVDRAQNFAMFTYKATVKDRDGRVIAECEASCNSQEKKYKERSVWEWNEQARKKLERKEETPIFDILNTLQKMSQKRAYVGAVILACGASDFFTQDIDDPEDASQMGITPTIREANVAPGVVNVSSQPTQNRQGGIWVEAISSYEQKDLVKSHGFRWDSSKKKWLKEISQDELTNGFPFEVKEVS